MGDGPTDDPTQYNLDGIFQKIFFVFREESRRVSLSFEGNVISYCDCGNQHNEKQDERETEQQPALRIHSRWATRNGSVKVPSDDEDHEKRQNREWNHRLANGWPLMLKQKIFHFVV